MKTILLAFALAATACAADLKLSDDRVLKDFSIVGQTPTTVTVKHANGGAKVEKRLLPPELLKLYPIDEQAAAAEAADVAKGKAIYDAKARAVAEKDEKAGLDRQAKTEKRRAELNAIEEARAQGRRDAEIAAARAAGRGEVTKEMAQRSADDALIDSHNRAAAGEVSLALQESITTAVKKRADRFFKTERKQPGSQLTLQFQTEIEQIRAVPGWSGRYEVVGVAWWQALESKGSSFTADKSWFRANVQLDKAGTPRVDEFTPLTSDPLK